MKVQFLMSCSPVNLKTALADSGNPTVTIEAEYGDNVVPGTLATLAHHGSRAGQAAPCSYPNRFVNKLLRDQETPLTAGLSHFDLDTLGGCAAILGCKPEVSGFWELVEFIDVNGMHKLNQSGADEQNIRRLYAFIAWLDDNKIFSDKDGSVADITDKVIQALEVINKIANDDPVLLKAGDECRANEKKLNDETFIESKDGVGLRVSPVFVNHLYTTPEGTPLKAVVSFKPQVGGVTVSFADPPKGKTAVQILQELFGEKAGGHAAIAGSPRGERLDLIDLVSAYEATVDAVKEN